MSKHVITCLNQHLFFHTVYTVSTYSKVLGAGFYREKLIWVKVMNYRNKKASVMLAQEIRNIGDQNSLLDQPSLPRSTL